MFALVAGAARFARFLPQIVRFAGGGRFLQAGGGKLLRAGRLPFVGRFIGTGLKLPGFGPSSPGLPRFGPSSPGLSDYGPRLPFLSSRRMVWFLWAFNLIVSLAFLGVSLATFGNVQAAMLRLDDIEKNKAFEDSLKASCIISFCIVLFWLILSFLVLHGTLAKPLAYGVMLGTCSHTGFYSLLAGLVLQTHADLAKVLRERDIWSRLDYTTYGATFVFNYMLCANYFLLTLVLVFMSRQFLDEEQVDEPGSYGPQIELRANEPGYVPPRYRQRAELGDCEPGYEPRSHKHRKEVNYQPTYEAEYDSRSYKHRSTPRVYEDEYELRSYKHRGGPREDERDDEPRSYKHRSAPRAYERDDEPRSYKHQSTPRVYEPDDDPHSFKHHSAPRVYEPDYHPRSYKVQNPPSRFKHRSELQEDDSDCELDYEPRRRAM